MSKSAFFFSLSFLILALFPRHGKACSRVEWSNNGQAVLVGRNFDWLEDSKTNLWIFPRGIAREGLAGPNSAKWVSRYGSVIASGYDIGTADGMNEKGLGARVLYLTEADFGKRDEKIAGLSISLWPQYFLDNFATVAEAILSLEKHPIQPLAMTTIAGTGKSATLHLSLEDATGDSAIIEYIKGQPKIYHGRQYTVLTNQPPFDRQLENMRQYQGFGGNKPLPGSTQPADRFVRAAYYLKQLPKPATNRQAMASLISVMRNVAEPYGTSDPTQPNVAPTIWRTVSDLSNGIYYFESSMNPFTIWVRLKDVDFSKDTRVKKLDLVNQPDLMGDVTKKFIPTKPFAFEPAPLGGS